MITALYTSLLGILWFILTLHVIFGRWKYRVSLGDGQQKDLNRRIRAHANFVETVPLAVLLLWLGESHVFGTITTHVMGSMLVISRAIRLWHVDSQTQYESARWYGVDHVEIGLASSWICIAIRQLMYQNDLKNSCIMKSIKCTNHLAN